MYPAEQLKPEQLDHVITDLIEAIRDTTNRLICQPDANNVYATVNRLLEIWLAFIQQVLRNSDQISEAQIAYWQDYLALCEDLHQHLAVDQITSASEKDAHWKDPSLIVFAQKYYFLVSRHARLLLSKIYDSRDSDQKRKLDFFHRKFVDAFSQANFMNDGTISERPSSHI